MSFKSPLAHARGLGSAKEGVAHWWMQRLTALALLPLVSWVVYGLLQCGSADHRIIKIWITNPFNSIALICLMLALSYHSSLGVQVIAEDYVRRQWLRRLIIVTVYFLKVLIAVTSIFAILKISFGVNL
ncbi:MAG: succinate dehydrogenase, hydrophobic membrane anchor protein [Gammaproteobacteria bacterium]|nr:succinate dehydrogenase, hydrophobic membrane anchor protein [Gammaproteobacteria bacterium]